MTRSSQKEGERFFVEKAAELLGREWCLGTTDRENPDFVVTEGEQKFGLEVCEVFTGRQSEAGSEMKKAESETKKGVNAFQREYEAKENCPLGIRFVGDMSAENMAAVVPALVAKNLSTKPFGHHDIIEVDEGEAKLRLHVTRALRADWFCVNDRAGVVDCDPIDCVAEEIKKKSKKLSGYKQCSGLDDIRLLIVANRIMNSGKLAFRAPTALDTKGFQVVYFFSYPESVAVIDSGGNGVCEYECSRGRLNGGP